jgi:hypothetical protein
MPRPSAEERERCGKERRGPKWLMAVWFQKRRERSRWEVG